MNEMQVLCKCTWATYKLGMILQAYFKCVHAEIRTHLDRILNQIYNQIIPNGLYY